jgi:hypothetical protein
VETSCFLSSWTSLNSHITELVFDYRKFSMPKTTCQGYSKRRFLIALTVICLSTSLAINADTSLAQASNCAGTSVPGLVPINDLGNGTYSGYKGGLYPEGSNTMPPSHLNAGLALANQVARLDKNGTPTPTGRIVLVSIGMSNTLIETNGLISLAKNDTNLNPSLVIVNGAESGVTASSILSNPSAYWSYVATQLTNANVTGNQVEAAWLKEADANPTGSNVTYAAKLSTELVTILQMMLQQFPHLKLVYLSSRIYAGYATSTLNPEPYAYASAFSVKWTIEEQLNGTASLNYNSSLGTVNAPWIAWGPYTWANGLSPRSDGLTWSCSDFQSDGTHPSTPQGQMKVGNMLLNFFSTDPTATPWFLKSGPATVGGTVSTVDKLSLIAPYLIMASLVTLATLMTFLRTKRTSHQARHA